MGTIRIFAKNSIMITISALGDKVLSFIFFYYVVRYLGDADFGKYSFIFAFINFFGVFTSFGTEGLTVREVAKDRSKANMFLVNTGIIKMVMVSLSWGIISILLLFLEKDAKTNAGILMIAFCILPDTLVKSFKAVFSGYEKMEYNTIIEIGFRLIIVSAGLFVIWMDYGFISIFAVSVISSICTLLGAIRLYTAVIGTIRFELDRKLCRNLLKESFPFFLTAAFISIYHQIDTVMLSVMKDDAVVGWYNAAHGLADALLIIPAAINGAIYPMFSRLQQNAYDILHLAFNKSFKFTLLFVFPVGLGTTILSEKIILSLFTPDFSNSITALRILIWSVMIIFLNAVMTPVLYSTNRQKDVALIVSIMAVINIILNLIVIPRYSYAGAAFSTIITELAGFFWLFYRISKNITSINAADYCLKSFAASILMGIVVYYLKDMNLFFVIALGAFLYSIVLVFLKTFDRQDIELIKEISPLNRLIRKKYHE